MALRNIYLLFCLFVFLYGTKAAVWDFDYDYTGYTKHAQILVTNCTTDIRDQINMVLGGKTTTICIEEPTTNQDLPHITCQDDPVMGKVINFTIYKNDDDSTGGINRSRIEMKTFNPSPAELKALNNTNYVFSWWFYLDPTLIPGDTGRTFWHIFQLKAVGTNITSLPVYTLTLTEDQQFHFRMTDVSTDPVTDTYFPTMLPISDILGRWIQVFIEGNFKNGNAAIPNENSGYVRVLIKDQFGNLLWPKSESTGENVGYMNTFWDGVDFVRPKWGLYRNLSDYHQDSDWELFQNIQIWQKI